jgi:DNA-binding transcriptional LysR family regulator
MLPSERALALAAPVREALDALASAMTPAASFDPQHSQRRFVIGTTDYVEFVLLPRLMAQVRRQAPGITLRIVSWARHRVSPALESGELDLMIGYYDDVPRGHRDELLFSDEFVCILRKGHPALRSKLSVERYAALAHVLVSEEDSPGVVDVALAKRGLRRHVALRMSHFLMVPPVIATSDLVAAVDRRVAEPFAKRLPIALVLPPLPLPSGRVGQVWHERTHSSAAHVWLRQTVVAASRSL